MRIFRESCYQSRPSDTHTCTTPCNGWMTYRRYRIIVARAMSARATQSTCRYKRCDERIVDDFRVLSIARCTAAAAGEGVMKTQVLRYESGCWFERPVGERSCDGAARHPGRPALNARPRSPGVESCAAGRANQTVVPNAPVVQHHGPWLQPSGQSAKVCPAQVCQRNAPLQAPACANTAGD